MMNNNISLRDGLDNRRERIILLYQIYLLEYDLDQVLEILYNHTEFNFTDDQIKVIKIILENKDSLEKQLINYLPQNWKWSRFGNFEKAILLDSTAELTLFKVDKAIIINEAVEFAKEYCDLKTPALINGILDNFNKKVQ